MKTQRRTQQDNLELLEDNRKLIVGLNESIPLKSGRFSIHSLENDADRIEVDGKFELQWFPTPDVVFSCETVKGQKIDSPFFFDGFVVTSESFAPLACRFRQTISRKDYFDIVGVVTHQTIESKEENISKLTFFLPNGRFFGSNSDTINGFAFQWTPLELNEWRLDLYVDPKSVSSLQDVDDGFRLTHFGILTRQNGTRFSEADAMEFLESLKLALSLMRGRWMAPVLVRGYQGDKLVLENFRPTKNSNSQKTRALFWWHDIDPLEEVMRGICALRNNKIWREEIARLIEWYIEANDFFLRPETALLLSQAALELCSWNELVNQRKEISPTGFDSLPASDKIRLLVSRLGLSLGVPSILSGLKKLSAELNLFDGPHALTEIRNSILHPKRKAGLKSVEHDTTREYKSLALLYLELSILFVIGYKGEVWQRIPYFESKGANATIPVPWIENWEPK